MSHDLSALLSPFEDVTADMFAAYIECALWSSVHYDAPDADGVPMDDLVDLDDLAADTLTSLSSELNDFVSLCYYLGLSWDECTDEQIGHDFWLTRNGHGAGFWDRGLGSLGEALSSAARTFGSCDLYIGDDGNIYAQ